MKRLARCDDCDAGERQRDAAELEPADPLAEDECAASTVTTG